MRKLGGITSSCSLACSRRIDNKGVTHSGQLIREFKENGVKHFEVRIAHDNENFTVIRYPKDQFAKDMDGVWTLLPTSIF